MSKEEIVGMPISNFFQKLATSPQGLRAEEAKKRLEQNGENSLKKESSGALRIFLQQFKSSLIYLLIVTAALSFFLQDFSDGIVISVILLINVFLGFFQEYRSERAIEKLSKLISKRVLTIRDGKTISVDEKQLVVGDIVILREGDIVPADIRIIESEDLLVNESQLTGESVPITKNATAQKDTNSLLFTGSIIEKGDTKGVVFATANNTELGKIAKLAVITKKDTQYEKSLQDFSNFLMRIILLTLLIVFLAKIFLSHDFSHITSLFLFVIALAITVIPEALPVIAIVTLSEGALKLAKKHVIVKRLSSLEDLGNVNLLCTDKTGTLTENKLTIQKLISENPLFFQQLAIASIEDLGIKKKKFQNSYDVALLTYIHKDIQEQTGHLKQINDLPFDPIDRRRRVIIEDSQKKKFYLVEIGSVETLLKVSQSNKKEEYQKLITSAGKQGLRHLGIAYKEIEYTKNFDILKHENNLKFLGFVQLVDPLRATTKQIIILAEKLGLAIKILTGDSKEVAEYIGRQVGLVKDSDKVYTGDEIEALSEQQLMRIVNKCNVFARVNPEQKYRIISQLKKSYTVAYQGDGINDAPSLKLADVAIAVENATDVAKESADIVLLEKDLDVIVSGIQYGRGIFVNINKYIKHTMVGNLGNFFSLAVLYLIAVDLPLLPVQLLLANLVQDIPLISIYSDNVDLSEVEKPEKYNVRSVMLISLFLGIFSAIYDFIYMSFVGFKTTVQTETSLFLFFTFTQLVVIFSVRSKNYFWQAVRPSWQVLTSVTTFFLVALLLSYTPWLSQLFSFAPLPLLILSLIVSATVIYIFLLDYIKVLYFRLIHAT